MQVGTKLRWSNAPDEVYVVSKITLDPKKSKDDLIDIDGGNLPGPVPCRRHNLDYLIGIGLVTIVSEGEATSTTAATVDEDCPECWGTGYYKGYGVVCSKGCHAKVTN